MWVLASLAASWWGIGAAGLVAIAAAVGIIYLRLPISWLVLVAVAYAAWVYTGQVYKAGRAECEASMARAVATERDRQLAVQTANDDKWKRVIEASDRDATALQKDKDLNDEAALADPTAIECGMSASGGVRLNSYHRIH